MEKTAKAPRVYTNGQKWAVFVFTMLIAFMANGLVYQIYNMQMSAIIADGGWDAAQQANVSQAYSLGLTIAVLFAGFVLDKLSPKWVMSIGAILCGVFTLLRGMTSDYGTWFALMLIFGIANGVVIPCVNKMIGLWFPPAQMAIMVSIVVMAPSLGQAIANAVGPTLVTAAGGWMNLFKILGILYAVFGLLMLLFTKARKSVAAAVGSQKIKTDADMKLSRILLNLIKVPEFWIILIYNTIYIGVLYAGSAYGNFAVSSDVRWNAAGLDASNTSITLSFANFSSMAFYFIAPWIIRAIGYKYHRIIAGIFVAMVPLSVWIGYNCFSIAGLRICMVWMGLCFGFAAPAAATFWMQIPEVSGPRIGSVMGIKTCIERLVTTILVGVVGNIVASHHPAYGGDGYTVNGLAVAWLATFACVPFVFILHALYVKKHKYLFGKEGKQYKDLTAYQKAHAQKEEMV